MEFVPSPLITILAAGYLSTIFPTKTGAVVLKSAAVAVATHPQPRKLYAPLVSVNTGRLALSVYTNPFMSPGLTAVGGVVNPVVFVSNTRLYFF